MYRLAALDFLIEDHAVESFPAFDKFLRKFQMGAGDKSEAIDDVFAPSLPLPRFASKSELPARGSAAEPAPSASDTSAPDRPEYRPWCRSGLFFLFLLIGVFFAVLVPVNFGRLDDVDLHTAKACEDQHRVRRRQ